jgi:hypothetical protein
MRLPLIAPADLSPEQRPVYDSMRDGVEKISGLQDYRRKRRSHGARGIRGCTSRSSVSRFGASRRRCRSRRRCHAMREKSLSPARLSTRRTSFALM